MQFFINQKPAQKFSEPHYLGQLLLGGKAQAKHSICSAVCPLAKLLRCFSEGHVRCDCAVYDHLFENRSNKELTSKSHFGNAPLSNNII